MPGGYDSRPPEPPARLGRYVTVRRLGAGGMAEVFLARSRGAEGTDKLLVVKRILPAFAANARFRTMFVDEARVALRLNHPNVVQVYGFESDGPSLLLVMEHIDGPDLSALAQAAHNDGARIPPGLVAWIVREVARGLHYAHERRDDDGTSLEIVHRDVSPGNVLLSHDGVVKLGDFGIAKARLVSGEDEGAIKGKFAYMPPEQARTEPVDRRADVYALGAVLGELLAGRPLSEGLAAGVDLLPRLRRDEVPNVHAAAPGAPEPLRAIAAKMLAADRADRYPTARDVALALTRYLRSLDEEWDAAALEQYVAQYFSRAPSLVPPPPGGLSGEIAAREAPTVAHMRNRHRARAPSRPPPGGTFALETSTLLRERVHVAVLVGRIIAPATTVDTVDTRPLFGLIESLAFKADAALERADDGQFTLTVGVVRPHVDHALRAARLAMDILEAGQALASDSGGEGTASLSVALGIARGVAAAARGASGTLLGFEVVDDAVIFAASLAQTASPGEALVAGGLYRLVRRAFVLSEHHTRAGVGTRTWRLDRIKTRAEREQEVGADRVALVGRDPELAQLREAMARVRASGTGQGLLLIGELGIGKSALVAAFAAECEPGGAVLRVPVAFGGAERPYVCVAQIVTEVLGVPEESESDVPTLDAAVERAIELTGTPSIAGRRAARRALRVALGLEDDDAGTEGATAREVALVLRRLLTGNAMLSSLLLVVDGIELADRHSRSVLLDLARKPPAGAVLVVLVARDDDPLAREAASMPTVIVPPVPEEVRGALVARRLGADEVSADLLREISAVAGGNPLMLLEVVEALSDRGRIEVVADDGGSRVRLTEARDGELPLPATLEEVLAARIEALPAEARTLLKWCALVDGELPAELLEALAGEDGPRALQRLLSDGVLVRARGRRDVVTFAHTALAKVARASIDPTLLPAMHAHIAAAIERRPGSRGIGAATVGRHREAAGAVRPATRAYLECASALRVASQSREALDAYARVLRLAADANDPEGFALRFASHLGREDIMRGMGLTRARRTELVALRVIAVDAKDPRLIARALARQARYKLETGLGGAIERDVAAATRAARRAGEPRTEAEAKRVLAVYLGQRGRYAEALHAADEALAALETRSALAPPPGGGVDDGVRAARTVRIEVLIAKGALLRQTGEVASAIEVYADTHALLSRHGPKNLLAHVLNNLGVACFSRGEYSDALRLYLASIAVSREIGNRDRIGMALSNAGQAQAALGFGERALGFLRKSLEVYAALGGRASGRADAHVALAELYASRGETELALAEVEKGRAVAEATGARYDLVRVKLGEAVVALARAEYRMARASAEEAERVAIDAGLKIYALHARAYAAEGAAGTGDRAAAHRYVDAVLSDPYFSEPLRTERGDLVLASCERVLRALGDAARADLLAALKYRTPAARGAGMGTTA